MSTFIYSYTTILSLVEIEKDNSIGEGYEVTRTRVKAASLLYVDRWCKGKYFEKRNFQ